MTIRITCAECASVLKIKDELAGTTAKCPKCKTEFLIPHPTEGSEVHEGETTATNIDRPTTPLNAPPKNTERTAAISRKTHAHLSSHASHDSDFDGEDDDSETSSSGAGTDASRDIEGSKSEADPTYSDVDPEKMFEDQPFDPAETSGENTNSPKFDDLDSPPLMITPPSLLPESDARSPTDTTVAKQSSRQISEKVGKAPPVAARTPEREIELPKSPSKRSSEEAFDPTAFLMEDSPKHKRPSSRPTIEDDDDDSDLSLPDDSDYDILERPSPIPERRRPIASAPSRPTPEKVDLAAAAKMMKKAIKDAQTDSVRQRKIDESAKYDYFLFFREIGLRGLVIICGLVVMVLGALILSNLVYRTTLKTPKLGIVRGTITLDGKPLGGAMIWFSPNKDLDHLKLKEGQRDRERTSIGVSDQQGNFKMMYAPQDNIEGVAVGPCRVWVTHRGPNGNDVPIGWSEIGLKEVVITEGRQKAPFDILMESDKKN